MSYDQLIFDLISSILFFIFQDRWGVEEWHRSFAQWRQEEQWRMSRINQLTALKQEWEQMLVSLNNGEYPYQQYPSELTQRLSKYAQATIRILEIELVHLKELGQ